MTPRLDAAIEFATRAHAGQVDKLGEPYISHPQRVLLAVPERARRVAVLHDVPEDTTLSVEAVAAEVGLDATEHRALTLLTRTTEPYGDYVEAIASEPGEAGEIARAVKLADVADNLGRMPDPPSGEWAPLHARYVAARERLGSS